MTAKGEYKTSKEELLNDIKKIINEFGDINQRLFKEYGKYSEHQLKRHFGGYKNLKKELNMKWKQNGELNKEDLEKDILRVFNEFGYIKKEIYEQHGKHSCTAIRHHYGSFNQMLTELDLPINMNKIPATKEQVLEDMKNLYNKYGYLNSELSRKEGKYKQRVIERLFGSFGTLLNELGIKENLVRISKEDLSVELKKIYNKYGYLNRGIIDEACSVTYQACTYKFGSREGIAEYLGIDEALLFKSDKFNSAKVDVLFHIIKDITGYIPIREKSWKWLVNPKTNKRMYVDLYIREIDTIIEYDGEQHFEYVPYYHDSYQDFLDGQVRDVEKEKLIKDKQKTLIRFDYMDKINENTVRNKLGI